MNPRSERILLTILLGSILFVVINAIIPQKSISFDMAELPENHMVIEGYVVSKRIKSIWLAEGPVNFTGIVSGYGANSINVSKHKDFKKKVNFRQLTLNQKVRVYCDYVRESNPPKTIAFHIEIIEDNE